MNRLHQLATTLLTLGILLLGTICVRNGSQRIGEPFPGFLTAENLVVVSVGRPTWAVADAARLRFSKLLAVDGESVSTADDARARVLALQPGTTAVFRVRQGAEVFDLPLAISTFSSQDFAAVYLIFFLVGSVYVLSGWIAVLRTGRRAIPFFGLCANAAVVLFTGSDLYGPYWFPSLYYLAHAITPATLLHLGLSHPEPLDLSRRIRRLLVTAAYSTAVAAGIGLQTIAGDSSLFLPAMYASYLLLANGLLIYITRLGIAVAEAPREGRTAMRWSIAALFLTMAVPGSILALYPLMDRYVSPIELIAPLVFFPILTAVAIGRARHEPAPRRTGSLRTRLTLMFLGLVETGFLAGIGLFWLNNSWDHLLDEMRLADRQVVAVETYLHDTEPTLADLNAIDRYTQSVDEQTLLLETRRNIDLGRPDEVKRLVTRLHDTYVTTRDRLTRRRGLLTTIDTTVVASLVILGAIQAMLFAAAIRRWLLTPINELAVATNVIATGNLRHQVGAQSSSEFSFLGNAINTMASSLAEIQQRIVEERSQRLVAASNARDAERRRFAKELHDSTLQDLTALKLGLEAALRLGVPPSNPMVTGLINTITDLRRVVDDMGPRELAPTELSNAIAQYARTMAGSRGIAVDLDLQSSAHLPEWAVRDVYRISQEAVGNALRHAAASSIHISYRDQDNTATLEITDDGSGFDPQTATLGSGLTNMRERAIAMGAQLDLVSQPGGPTTVRLRLPLP